MTVKIYKSTTVDKQTEQKTDEYKITSDDPNDINILPDIIKLVREFEHSLPPPPPPPPPSKWYNVWMLPILRGLVILILGGLIMKYCFGF